MAGLLDIPGIDPETLQALQGLMGLMGPQQDDLKKINSDKWLNFGLGLLSGKKGDELGAIGRAGLNAVQTANQERTQLQLQRGQNLSQAGNLLTMARQHQGLQDDANLSKSIGGIFSQSGQGQQGPQLQNMGQGGPTPANATAVAPPPAPSQEDRVRAQAAQLRQVSQAYAAAGPKYATQFKQYADAADALEKQLEYSPDPRTVMKDGQPTLALVNKSGGTRELNYAPAVPIHFQDTGAGYQGLNSLTGAPISGAAGAKTQSPDSKASNALGWAGLAERKRATNLQYGLDEKGDPTGSTDALAKSIANYDTPFPATIMYRRPEMGAQILQKVQEINPTYDAKNYATAQQSMNAFAKGKEGATTRSLNVAMQHLDVLQEAAAALKNGDYPALNKIANMVGTQAGSSAPNTYNAIAAIVGNEVVKAVVGSGGGVEDRAKSQKVLADFSNPASIAGVVSGYKNLFAGQLSGLETQYKAGTGKDDFKEKFLHPDTARLLKQQTGPKKEDLFSAADAILQGR